MARKAYRKVKRFDNNGKSFEFKLEGEYSGENTCLGTILSALLLIGVLFYAIEKYKI